MPQVCMKGNHALTWRLANSQAEKPASDSSKPETKSTETYARCAGKELKMRFKARSLLLGTCLMAGILAANVPVEARTTTGWNSFRVWSPIGADNCVGESFGAAVNVCRSNINLTFELLVDSPGEKTVTVMDNPDGYGVLTCAAVAFSGQDGGLVSSYPQTFNPSGQETLTFHVTVSPGWGLSLYCWDVSPTKGIATIKWNP